MSSYLFLSLSLFTYSFIHLFNSCSLSISIFFPITMKTTCLNFFHSSIVYKYITRRSVEHWTRALTALG